MEKSSEIFLQYGALGAMVLVLLFGIIYLFKTLLVANDARVSDLVAFKTVIADHTSGLRDLVNALKTLGDKIDQILEKLDRLDRR